MDSDTLPYGLQPLAFPFPALASLAGRLPLGGGREVALASLMVARLAQAVQSATTADRVARASAAKIWLASLALPATTRVPLARSIEASTGTALQAATALRAVIAAVSSHLDGMSILELERFAKLLANAS